MTPLGRWEEWGREYHVSELAQLVSSSTNARITINTYVPKGDTDLCGPQGLILYETE